jgi:hypothetical protein
VPTGRNQVWLAGTLTRGYGGETGQPSGIPNAPGVRVRGAGTTRAVVQGATVVESYDYDPYGLLMPGRTLGSGTKEGFTSKERDAETGLDYFGARVLHGGARTVGWG